VEIDKKPETYPSIDGPSIENPKREDPVDPRKQPINFI
jgi:hypothetical protein